MKPLAGLTLEFVRGWLYVGLALLTLVLLLWWPKLENLATHSEWLGSQTREANQNPAQSNGTEHSQEEIDNEANSRLASPEPAKETPSKNKPFDQPRLGVAETVPLEDVSTATVPESPTSTVEMGETVVGEPVNNEEIVADSERDQTGASEDSLPESKQPPEAEQLLLDSSADQDEGQDAFSNQGAPLSVDAPQKEKLDRKEEPSTDPPPQDDIDARPDQDSANETLTTEKQSIDSNSGPQVAAAEPETADSTTQLQEQAWFPITNLPVVNQNTDSLQSVRLRSNDSFQALAITQGTVVASYNHPRDKYSIYLLSDDKRWVFFYTHLTGPAPGIKKDTIVQGGKPIGQPSQITDGYYFNFSTRQVPQNGNWWEAEPVDSQQFLRKDNE